MVCPSQAIPLRELWDRFNPIGFEQGIFVILRGYIDESYNKDRTVFVLSCLLSTGSEWAHIVNKWKRCLRHKNKELVTAGRKPISRYHASESNARDNEFEGWNKDELREFSIKLISILGGRGTDTAAYCVNLNELRNIFMEKAKEDVLVPAYDLLTQYVVTELGSRYERVLDQNVKITLFHDWAGKYNAVISNAFSRLIDQPDFRFKSLFTTIAPLHWEDCIALQPADLVAFEMMKAEQQRLVGRKALRPSLQSLIDLGNFGVQKYTLTKTTLLALKKVADQ